MRSLGFLCLLCAPALADEPAPAIAETYVAARFHDAAAAAAGGHRCERGVAARPRGGAAASRCTTTSGSWSSARRVQAASLGDHGRERRVRADADRAATRTAARARRRRPSQEGGAGEIVTFDTDDWRMSLAQRLSTACGSSSTSRTTARSRARHGGRAAELSLDAAAVGHAADPARVLDRPRDPAHRRAARADRERARARAARGHGDRGHRAHRGRVLGRRAGALLATTSSCARRSAPRSRWR